MTPQITLSRSDDLATNRFPLGNVVHAVSAFVRVVVFMITLLGGAHVTGGPPVGGGTAGARLEPAASQESGSQGTEDVQEGDTCPTDINGDGATNVLDVIELLLCFGQPAMPPCDTGQDVNGDGTVDVLDLIELLGAIAWSVGADGWTILTPTVGSPNSADDTRFVYVSAAGSDSSGVVYSPTDVPDPFNPPGGIVPFRTLAGAFSHIRNGKPDWLLLRRGDTWDENFPTWEKSGASAGAPILVSAYGIGPRPTVGDGDGIAFDTRNCQFLAIVSVHFAGSGTTDQPGIRTLNNQYNDPTTDWLIEDCLIQGFGNGMDLNGTHPDSQSTDHLTIRRSIIVDNQRQGIWSNTAHHLTIEECIFDSNGTSSTHDHNLYLAWSVDLKVRGCISSRAADSGFKIQSLYGGLVEDNVFFANGSAASPNVNPKPEYPGLRVIDLVFRGNVAVEMGSNSESTGLYIWSNQNCHYLNNLFINSDYANHAVFSVRSPFNNEEHAGPLQGLYIENNTFFNWRTNAFVRFRDWAREDVFVSRNIFQTTESLPGDAHAVAYKDTTWEPNEISYADNIYFIGNTPTSQWFRNGPDNLSFDQWKALTGESGAQVVAVDFADPNRSISAYDAQIGGPGTIEHFMTQVRGLSKANWNDSLTAAALIDYFRAGFTPTTDLGTPAEGEYHGAVPP